MKKVVCVLLAGLVLCGSAVAQKKVHLKIASMAPSRSPWDIEQRALAQEWSEITNGQVSITFYDTLSLGEKKALSSESGLPARDGARFLTARFSVPSG